MKLAVLLIALSGYVVIIQGSRTVLVPHPGGIGGIFKGPDSETIIHGPDGSIITSEQEGGAVKTGAEPILVAEERIDTIAEVAAPAAVPLATASIAPILAGEATPLAVAPVLPVVDTVALTHQSVRLGTKEPHIIETELVDAPFVEPNEASDLVGPSGSISRRGSNSIVSGPASTTISESVRTVALPVAAVPIVAPVAAPVRTHVATPILASAASAVVAPAPIRAHVGTPIVPSVIPPIAAPGPSFVTSAPRIGVNALPALAGGSVALPPPNVAPEIVTGNVEIAHSLSPSTLPPPTLLSTQSLNSEIGGYSGSRYSTLAPSAETVSLSTPAPYNNFRAANTRQSQSRQGQAISSSRNNRQRSRSRSRLRLPKPFLATPPAHNSVSFESNANTNLQGPTNSDSLRFQQDVVYQTQSDNTASVQQTVQGQIASAPEVSISSTFAPSSYANSRLPDYNQQNVIGTQQQIVINPANIPSRNIVPPEIKLPPLPKGAIDLGATVSVTSVPVPRANGLFSPNTDSSGDQRLNQVDNVVVYNNGNDRGQENSTPYTIQNSDSRTQFAQSAESGWSSGVQNSDTRTQFTQSVQPDWSGAVQNSDTRSQFTQSVQPDWSGAVQNSDTRTQFTQSVQPNWSGAVQNSDTRTQFGQSVQPDWSGAVQNSDTRTQFAQPDQPDLSSAVLRNPGLINRQGDINSQLNQQGIDASQINFEQVPLSSASPAPASFYDVYEDSGQELANRYGRRSRRNA